MIDIDISKEEASQLEYFRYNYPDPLIQRRFEVIWLKFLRYQHKEIAKIANIHHDTVTDYIKLYNEGGCDRLLLTNYRKPIGAVCNESYINANCICEMFQKLVIHYTGIPITIVLDNARYQKCKIVAALASELGIELLYLPSYSPNLNLIERLWKFVKMEVLYCKYYSSFTSFKGGIEGCLSEINNIKKSKVASLLSLKFHIPTKEVSMAA